MWYVGNVCEGGGYGPSRDPDQYHPLSFSEARDLVALLNRAEERWALQATMAAIGWMTVIVGPVAIALHLWGAL